MKNPWAIVGVMAVVLIGGAVVYSSSAAEKNNEGVEIKSHIKGNPEAVVKLVEYSDFQCPACGSFQPIITDVLEEFGEELSFEYKHFPLPIHNLAESAARAAEAAAQQDAFFAYHDLLFINQATWSRSPNPSALFIKYAEELELDIAKFKRHMNSSMLGDKVKQEGSEARAKGLTGTPTFFLNGERMTFKTYDEFRNQIAKAINPEVDFGVDGTPIQAEVSSEPAVQFGI